MPKEKTKKGPNFIHPEKPSAVGSRNSLNRDNRNEYQEATLIVDEEIDKLLNHIKGKLPPEVLDKLDIMGSVKDKLHNYYNQNFQNMTNRYLVTTEDELLKRYRDLIDREEDSQLYRYTPRSISEIITKIGGEDRFNTAAVEKSIVNIYEHLQGHLLRGMQEIEHNTNNLLRQKTDVGAFIRQENAYSIVKCAFKSNREKPKTVLDSKLAINILDSELITPIYHYQKSLQQLLKEIVSRHIQSLIDQHIERINAQRLDSGQEELSNDDKFLEKIKSLENHLSFDDDPDDENSKRYDFIAKRFIDSLESESFEISEAEIQDQNIRENVRYILDKENIQNSGFNKVVNALTTILDDSKMGYQYIDNMKNGRVCVIREYALRNRNELPDETFALRLSYFDNEQLIEFRSAYDLQYQELSKEIKKVGEVVDRVFAEYCQENDIQSYQSVSKMVLKPIEMRRDKKWWHFGKSTDDETSSDDEAWNELTFMAAGLDETDTSTNINKSIILKKQIKLMKKKIQEVFGNQHPRDRFVLEERVGFLEDRFQGFAANINPHHLQQGLVLEVDITSVKRKRTTMIAMSNVLNEFLFRVSKGFVDQAITANKGPRIVVGENIEKKFTSILRSMDKSLEEVEA